jgi:hypothetical protein
MDFQPCFLCLTLLAIAIFQITKHEHQPNSDLIAGSQPITSRPQTNLHLQNITTSALFNSTVKPISNRCCCTI